MTVREKQLRKTDFPKNQIDKSSLTPYNMYCFGPVAQLGERRVRIAEVEGSNPFGSTMKSLHVTCLIYRCRVRAFLLPYYERYRYWKTKVLKNGWPEISDRPSVIY